MFYYTNKYKDLFITILVKNGKRNDFFQHRGKIRPAPGGESSPPMSAPFLTDEERERYRGSYLL
ncbi:MAG: hypothetical protein EGP90_12360 [Bacteroides sp.]|uniref:Uncharacterized protein n=1 Tax=Bacteroides xylanisolvens SD CC 1b TaxID=702447 RepID=W6PCP8_9BACE|nr:hypothetical protein [Bacteroides sp.]CDM00916.1 hypothetical protein BN891_38440 [Bacteroides xylanisolvens SD CC 2a]CDM07499.1 hypothetical protein BN890_51230 [Bacteroides xylanisolvens SD CC 1b]